jgi:glycerophosphoryl diester phosphodiesterase
MIELDVRLSRDGELVVIHDARINRTSNGRGRVADLILAELKQCSYHNGMTVFGFIPIPTLAEVIASVGSRVLLNVEIKGRWSKRTGIERKLADLLRAKHCVDRVIISSFNRKILAEMKRVDGEVRTGLLYDATWKRFREDVRALGVRSVHPELAAVESGALRWASSCGIKVYPWVAKDRDTVERCRAMRFIDGVMVNDLGLFGAAIPCGSAAD